MDKMEKKGNAKKRYKCNKCEHAARWPLDLERHVVAVHDKLKNFKCNLCEYAASLYGTLKRHVRAVHAKEKNFKCDSVNMQQVMLET